MASEAFFLGLNTSLGSRRFSLVMHGNKIRFTTTRMHGDWCPSASAVSGTPLEPGEEAAHESQSIHLIPSNARQECVHGHRAPLVLIRSFLLRSDREVRAGTNLCWRYAFLACKRRVANIMSVKTLSGDC